MAKKNHYNSRTLNINLLELVIKKNKSLLLWVKSRGYFISGNKMWICFWKVQNHHIIFMQYRVFCYDPLPLKQISFECVAMPWQMHLRERRHIRSFPHLFFKDATHRASNHKCIPNLFTSFAQNSLKDFFFHLWGQRAEQMCPTDVRLSMDSLIFFLTWREKRMTFLWITHKVLNESKTKMFIKSGVKMKYLSFIHNFNIFPFFQLDSKNKWNQQIKGTC